MHSDYEPQHHHHPRKIRRLSCSEYSRRRSGEEEKEEEVEEKISNKLLSFLNIESDSSFMLNKNDVSGGSYREVANEETEFLPNYEQEQQLRNNSVKSNIILNSLEEKLVQCRSKVNHDSIVKLLKVTKDLSETKFMNNNKLKHRDVPHKEIIRVLVNDIAKNKNKDIANTVRNLIHIQQDKPTNQ